MLAYTSEEDQFDRFLERMAEQRRYGGEGDTRGEPDNDLTKMSNMELLIWAEGCLHPKRWDWRRAYAAAIRELYRRLPAE
ncbi:MAG: hypothetical protein KKF27_21340 [Gammaproteobacteria bacterium]|nr:hypothetical protein [Gammaproteobacteria bacterium]